MDLDASTSASTSNDLITLTADVVSAYLSKNTVAATDVPGLIASVHGAFARTGQPAAPEVTIYEPAVPIRKSITPDALISLIDGKPYRTLKRHLTRYGLTIEGYRQRYGLPYDYPSVAPSYSTARSELAKATGLGGHRRKSAPKTAK